MDMSDKIEKERLEDELRALRKSNELLQKELALLTESKRGLARLASFPVMNPNPIVEVGTAGEVKYMNPAAKRLFPELEEMGVRHPFLDNFKTLIACSQDADSEVPASEVQVGNSWYERLSYFVSENNCVRIYARDITSRKEQKEELTRRIGELRVANEDLSRFNMAAVDRELRMVELKKQVNRLCAELGKQPPYDLDFAKEEG